MDEMNNIFCGKDKDNAFGAKVAVASDGSHLILQVAAYGVRIDFAMPPQAAMALGYDLVAGSRTAKAIAADLDDDSDDDELDDGVRQGEEDELS